ncbi:4-hydroxyphenylacetate 3-hydroxylase N-terminal domain-containing protein [Pseudomonas chlororaphis]|uniref:4-hydroxyphenylacetate 3-hydroxylase N-terminal domain-containing protein n=1 Tax=Pseudomonas chlororaphis TaxID=587753 RepID=UPI0019D02A4A|nr:4-hydroxyphenylacetate 3-hydroxylase N-terminal domain-containing protein [Pseudomonas chlororaphis]
MLDLQNKRKYLKSAESFKASLRDDRTVIYQGQVVEDVTTHFSTAGGISQVAEIYEEQFSGEHDDILTYVRPDGYLASSAYMPLETKKTWRRDAAQSRTSRKKPGAPTAATWT